MSLYDRVLVQELAGTCLYDRVMLSESAMPANALDIFHKRLAGEMKKLGIPGAQVDPARSFLSADRKLALLRFKASGRAYLLRITGKGSHWASQLEYKNTIILQGTGTMAFLALRAMEQVSIKKVTKTPALKKLTAAPPKPKHVPAPTPTPAAQQTETLGIYKGKRYQVVAYHSGGNVVELAWFSDSTKSFKVATKKVQITDPPGGPDPKLAPKPISGGGWFRFSTTLVNGKALKDRGVDVVRVKGPDGAPIGGAKRTQRTGGWRDRILQKFTQLSGLKAQPFGDKKTKFHTPPSTADWELIKEKIAALPGVTAYFAVPKGWHQTALIVQVS